MLHKKAKHGVFGAVVESLFLGLSYLQPVRKQSGSGKQSILELQE